MVEKRGLAFVEELPLSVGAFRASLFRKPE
jgi:hypothetical protein